MRDKIRIFELLKRESLPSPVSPELLEAWKAHFEWRTSIPARKTATNPHEISEAVSAAAPGQLWRLKRLLDGFDADGRWLNMPTVLLLSRSETSLEAVVTAPFAELMGGGDVYLGEDEGFAESWNRLALPQNALGERQGTIEPGLLELVKSMDSAFPARSGADWEDAFFLLETDVAEAARQRVSALAFAPAGWLKELGNVWAGVKNFASAMLPPAPVAFAAASEGQTLSVTYLTNGGLMSGSALVTGLRREEGLISLKGELSGPVGFPMDAFFACLETESGEKEQPLRSVFTPPFFALDFEAAEPFSLSLLRLLVVSYGA